MKRIHFFEISDQPWFPAFLRNYMTDFLQFGANMLDVYKKVVPYIVEGIKRSGTPVVIDLASGSGGGMIKLARHLQVEVPDLKIVLTDYYPNLSAFERTQKTLPNVFGYTTQRVDARNVPSQLKGLRTMFLAFHHFKPTEARKILSNAVSASMPIAIFEIQQRNLKSLIPMLLSPINVLLMTPFITPFRVKRLVFTYLIPLVPLAIIFDGIVSVLRTYSEEELSEMIADIPDAEAFEWHTKTVKAEKSGPTTVSYLIGLPRTFAPSRGK